MTQIGWQHSTPADKTQQASLIRAVCGVLDEALPLTAHDISRLLPILRAELTRNKYQLSGVNAIEPWHYLTERQGGVTVLSKSALALLRQPADHRATSTISNTLKQWRNQHEIN
ncbi:MAG: hypothetical protein ACRC9N_12075 [Aeromonas sp.]